MMDCNVKVGVSYTPYLDKVEISNSLFMVFNWAVVQHQFHSNCYYNYDVGHIEAI
jgi:hypothetical protein